MSDANFTPQFDDADVDGNYGSTGGDITVPTFQGIKPFRFWCQKALPLIYDDSLSYYEVLCKVVNYLNNMMTDLNTATGSIAEFSQQFVINQQFLNSMAQQLGENTEELEDYVNARMQDFLDAYNELQDYVNDYFDNLDVQEEINTKLDVMAEDGTLDTLLEPFTRDWLEDKTEEIDSEIASQNATLAQQNSTLATQNSRISVLEGRMDTFSTLPSGSTSANAELVDIRTNFLGETYDNAGDAVRASDLIASGFMAVPPDGRHDNWYLDGHIDIMNSAYNTISIDITKYKGGKIAFIFNSYATDADDYLTGLEKIIAKGNTATPNENAVTTYITTYINVAQLATYTLSSENWGSRLLLIIAVPETETAQYYYLPYTEFGPMSPTDPPQEPEPDNVIYPNFILYASAWSKTPVDPTLSITGEAADAKVTGDAIGIVNDEINEIDNRLDENPLTSIHSTPFEVSYPWQSGDARYNNSARCFWSEIIPANATITEAYTYIASIGANPSITFEIWEIENDSLKLKTAKTITNIQVNANVICSFDDFSDKPRMICYRSANIQSRSYRTGQTGYSWKYTSDVSAETTTLALSGLSSFSGMKLIGGFTYTVSNPVKRNFFSGILDGNIIVFGDSTVDGSSVTGHTNNTIGTDRTATAEPNVYTSIVETMINTFTGGSKRVYNAGFGGKTLNYIADNYTDIMNAFSNVKSAILVIDANSASGTRTEYEEGIKNGLKRMFELLKADGISFAVMSPQPMFFYPADDGTLPAINSAGEYYIGVNIGKDLCKQYNVPFIDLGNKTNYMMDSPYLNNQYFLGDRIHFGDNGHRVEAYELYGELIHPILYFDGSETYIGLQSNKGELSETSGISATFVGGYQSIVLSASNTRTDVLHRIYVLSRVPFTIKGITVSGWTAYYDVLVDGETYTSNTVASGNTIPAGWHEITVKPTATEHIVRYSGLVFEKA